MTIFNDWLSSTDQIKCVLVEVQVFDGSSNQNLYFSSSPFQDSANVYAPVVRADSIIISERLSLSGGSGSSIGDIEVDNTDGSLDQYLYWVWSMRPCKVYFGDARWNRADFHLVFDGIIDDIATKDRDSFNLRIRDKLSRLDSPITETTLGGVSQNKDSLLPITLGEVFNITPLLVDSANLEYQVHHGSVGSANIEGVIEVRDNGVPVNYTNSDASKSKIKLSAQPFGQITASVQGLKSGANWLTTIADSIKHVVKNYGQFDLKLNDADIDLTNFSDFNTVNNQPVGLYLDTSDTVLNVCNSLASSIGAQIIFNAQGLLQLFKIDLSGSPTLTINDTSIIAGSLSISAKIPVQGSFKVGYSKNYTVQPQLDTRIPASAKSLMAKEWLESKAEDAAVKATYKQFVETEMIETNLVLESDADDFAAYMLELYKTPRFIFSMQCTPTFLDVNLGELVTLQNSRFDLGYGKNGQIIGKQINYGNGTINIGGTGLMAAVLNPRDNQLQSETRTQPVELPDDYTIDYSQVDNGPPANATSNFFTSSTSDPTGGTDGNAHYNISTGVMWFKVGGTWQKGGTVNASSITTGFLAVARIAASSITVSKLSITTLSSITSNLGTVNAGAITGSSDIDIAGTAKFNGTTPSAGVNYAVVCNESLDTPGGILGYAGPGGFGIRGQASGMGTGSIGVSGSNTTGDGTRGTATSGIGVRAVASTGVALRVEGTMEITSSGLVGNLNAQRWNGCTNSSVTSGGATATFNGANKPGSNLSNSWWPVVISGTTRYIVIPAKPLKPARSEGISEFYPASIPENLYYYE